MLFRSAKETKTDFRRVEAASLKMPARFTSAEGKRFFVRLFNTLQLNGNSPTSTVLVPAAAGRHHRLMECVPA